MRLFHLAAATPGMPSLRCCPLHSTRLVSHSNSARGVRGASIIGMGKGCHSCARTTRSTPAHTAEHRVAIFARIAPLRMFRGRIDPAVSMPLRPAGIMLRAVQIGGIREVQSRAPVSSCSTRLRPDPLPASCAGTTRQAPTAPVTLIHASRRQAGGRISMPFVVSARGRPARHQVMGT